MGKNLINFAKLESPELKLCFINLLKYFLFHEGRCYRSQQLKEQSERQRTSVNFNITLNVRNPKRQKNQNYKQENDESHGYQPNIDNSGEGSNLRHRERSPGLLLGSLRPLALTFIRNFFHYFGELYCIMYNLYSIFKNIHF